MTKRRVSQAIVVLGLITNEEGKFLLTKRHQPELPSAHHKWQIPGGKVEIGEDPLEALYREIKEELYIDVEIVELLPYVGSSLWEYNDHQDHVVLICYLLRYKQGVIKLDDDAVEFAWLDGSEIKKSECLPMTGVFIKHARYRLTKDI